VGFRNCVGVSGFNRVAIMNKGVQWPLAIVERVGCTYSMFLQIERIWYAAEFVHPTRVGFVNSIARICRQIQRSGGGARPPGSGRAIVARRLSRQFALPSDADAKRARDIWDLAIPSLRRTVRRGEGLHLQPEL